MKPGDGTFYAPKIDIYVDDALGREWQLATIQVDLVMLPERFDLSYIDEHGQPQRPIAIHRAIYGSLERFIGILIEHFAGAFPFWCAPVQAVVVPIADRHNEAAARARRSLLRAAASASRSTTAPTACRTRSAWPRSRRCPTCSCSAIARWRRAAAAPRTRAGEQQEPLGWEGSSIRLAAEATSARARLRGPAVAAIGWLCRRVGCARPMAQGGTERADRFPSVGWPSRRPHWHPPAWAWPACGGAAR